MMQEPWFWREKTFVARAVSAGLAPAAFLYEGATRWRAANTRPEAPPVPVFCIGNATLGGSGKTPFALMLQRLLQDAGVNAHFLTRGYGGALRGPVNVLPSHTALDVGDEALLLARAAPTIVARNRRNGARAAAEAGAEAIIMDDGYQNPAVAKTLSFLLTDAADPYGNGRVFPAGPLRETPASALARADAVVLVTSAGARSEIAPAALRADFRARLESAASLAGKRVVAFCGIARPQRFFATLQNAGAVVLEAVAFADHHRFSDAELARLRKLGVENSAALITTEKDFVRLPLAAREGIATLPVRMACDDPGRLKALALKAISDFKRPA